MILKLYLKVNSDAELRKICTASVDGVTNNGKGSKCWEMLFTPKKPTDYML